LRYARKKGRRSKRAVQVAAVDALESEGRRREVIGKQDEIFAAAAI
jgi:hypothetical protein